MAGPNSRSDVSIPRLIAVPALITLAITLLRLAGELLGWSRVLFSRAAGGGGALVGIVWLVPVFGAYFGVLLAKSGLGPRGRGKPIGFALLGLAALVGLSAVAMPLSFSARGLMFVVASVVGGAIAYFGWPALGRTLLAYGFAARVPVAVVMLIAILGNWGTHYDVPPPGAPAMGLWEKYFWIALLPQFSVWIAFTMIIGGLFGAIATFFTRPRTSSV
jgi:hypothetical protein